MPPAKGKKSAKKVAEDTQKVELPPVIFLLRIGKEFDFNEERVDVPAPSWKSEDQLQYSDILQYNRRPRRGGLMRQ